MENDSIVMFLIVREKLNMSIGKTAAQVGHAVGLLYEMFNSANVPEFMTEEDYKFTGLFQQWINADYRKIVLKADDKEFEKLKTLENNYVIVIDKGLTELDPGTETVIGFYPMLKSQTPKLIKRLQLLK